MSKRLSLILAFAIPFAAYLPTLWGTFYYDDNVVFFGHQVKALAEAPLSVFSPETHYLPGAPRSIHVFFLLLIYKAFGASPLPYHLFNLAMHCATTVLVFVLIKRLTVDGETPPAPGDLAAPLMGSLIFGLHPVHVENIAFVTLGGTDVFYTFWALLSLMCYIWFRDKVFKGGGNYLLLAGSALAYAFALMSKESAVAFVLIYPLTELALRRRGILWALPHAAVLLLMRWTTLSGAASVVGESAAGPADAIKSLGFFAKSLAIPYPHMPYIKEFPGAPLLYAFVALVALWLAAGLATRKRMVTYSALWFALLSVPYLFVPAIVTNVAITAERYIYAPSVGFAILGGWALATGCRSERFRTLTKTLAALVLVVYGSLGMTYYYQAWRTEEAFWRYAIRTNRDYVSAYSNLATMKLQSGELDEAESILLEGLKKEKGKPEEFAQAAYALGNIYGRKGDIESAAKYYTLSLSYADFEFAYRDLGFIYLDAGKWERARGALAGALKFRRDPRVLAGLALASIRLGEKEDAAVYAREAVELARDEELKDFAAGILKEASQ